MCFFTVSFCGYQISDFFYLKMDTNNKPKVDPGWNDPPMLSYNASNPPPKSRIRNKRVAFPLSTTNSVPQQPYPNLPPLPIPVFSIENTKDYLGKFFTSDESRDSFYKIWDSELSDECKESVSLMTECLVKSNKAGAEIHKQNLLKLYKTLCENWLKDVKF